MRRMIAGFVTVLQWKSEEKLPEYGKNRPKQGKLGRFGEFYPSFSHTRPNGASCFTALTEAGVSYARAGENIAYGQSTPEAVVQSWMNSSGHRANILSSSFTSIGVGCTVVNGTAYWAQLFTA